MYAHPHARADARAAHTHTHTHTHTRMEYLKRDDFCDVHGFERELYQILRCNACASLVMQVLAYA